MKTMLAAAVRMLATFGRVPAKPLTFALGVHIVIFVLVFTLFSIYSAYEFIKFLLHLLGH